MIECKLVPVRWEGALLGVTGIGFGGLFLWLALRNIDPAEARASLRQLSRFWLFAGVVLYLSSIGVRRLRWGVLLRTADDAKWRHPAEALLIGFAANYVLPGRVGLLRADYARIFNMSRFTSVGTIVVGIRLHRNRDSRMRVHVESSPVQRASAVPAKAPAPATLIISGMYSQ